MEAIPKIGIIVGIAAVIVFLIVWVPVTVANNEHIFAKVFFDEDIHIKKMESTDVYKTMMERYPDAFVTSRSHSVHGSNIEMKAYNNNSDNELRVDIHYQQADDMVWESARCQTQGSSDHKKLGTVPPEIMDDPPIPKAMFTRGDAQTEFASDFVRYTNCLEMDNAQEILKEGLEADYHIAIPENTGMPGCQEDLTCFEPYSLKIKVGDVVSFRNFDSDFHTVTSGIPENGPNGEFDSALMEAGSQFLHEFTQADEYDYFCMIHPWQTGKIIVYEK